MEDPLNRAVLEEIVEEIAPRLRDARITGVSAPAPDCLILEISADAPLRLGALAIKALPVIFLAEGSAGAEESGPASGAARELKGAHVLSVSAAGDEPVAELRLRRTE